MIVVPGGVPTLTSSLLYDLGYIYHSLFTSHYTVPTNSASISNALVAPLPPSNVHLSTTITAFTRDPVTNTTSVSFLRDEKRTDPERMDGFNSIIVATQANQARYLLESLTDTSEKQSNSGLGQVMKCLADFRYEVRAFIRFIFISVMLH